MSINKWFQSTGCTNNAIWKSTRCVQAKNSTILFKRRPFFVLLHVERSAQECLSVLSVSSGGGIIVETIWQGILRLFQWTEFSIFLGYLQSIGKVCKCLFDRMSNPLEKQALYVLFMYPSPFEICLFQTPYPLEFPWPSVGGGGKGYFLESHNGPTILVKNLETLVSVSPSQCWFGYHSGLSASKHPSLNIGEGEGTFRGGKQWEVEISGFFQKIREKLCLFQRFVTTIVFASEGRGRVT